MLYFLSFTGLSQFMPHGMCYMWRWDLLLLHVGSDLAIALAYFSIPYAVFSFVRSRPDIPPRIYLLFATFILLCGITHVMSIVVVWHPLYYIQGVLKSLTAIISIATAYVLWKELPVAIAITPSFRQIIERNKEIESLNEKLQERVDSLTTLAGGVAHDFNNLLAIITGNTELLKRQHKDEKSAERIESIELTVQRATAISQRMLAYSGKGAFALTPLDLNAVLRNLAQESDMVSNASFDLDKEIPQVEGATQQIEQMVTDLVQNSIEAQKEAGITEGSITVSTQQRYVNDVELGTANFSHELEAGQYVVLEVSDDGPGMDKTTRTHMFDPYFSTHFMGRGLGLAAVIGIVRGHNGSINVTSQLGSGTSIKIFFPPLIAETEESEHFKPAATAS